jgi:hypothetical protein
MTPLTPTKSTLFSILLGTLFVVGLATAPAHAQATRTWVSGVGNDANPCSRTAPCKTFAGAISKTAAAGEIDVLDPGGFGTITITKSISIYNDGVGEAGVLASGTNGITINAATTDVVNLRGLTINGLNGVPGSPASPNGVQVLTAARVTIENCVIQQFTTGVDIAPATAGSTTNVKIMDTIITNNNTGLLDKPTSGAIVNMSIDRVRIDNNNGGGVRIDGTGGGSSNVAINDGSISLNAGNAVNSVSGSSGNVKVDLARVTLADNGSAAVQANDSAGGTSTVTVGSSVLSNNNSAWSRVNTASLLSLGNNQVTGPAGTGPSGGLAPQ